jgi:chromate transporter
MFVGYKLRGVLGAITAIIGITFVPFWTIVFLASVIGLVANNHYVQGIFWGIGIAVTALIILTVREIWRKSDINLFFYFIFVSSIAALLFTKLSPVQVIIIFTFLGVLIKKISNKGGAV